VSYGIIFAGNSSHSSVIFKMEKSIIMIVMGHGFRGLAENYSIN
jgi:hypothetical protein